MAKILKLNSYLEIKNWETISNKILNQGHWFGSERLYLKSLPAFQADKVAFAGRNSVPCLLMTNIKPTATAQEHFISDKFSDRDRKENRTRSFKRALRWRRRNVLKRFQNRTLYKL